jgi:hypothetical protein
VLLDAVAQYILLRTENYEFRTSPPPPRGYSLSYVINPKQFLKETGTDWSERNVVINLYIDQRVGCRGADKSLARPD